jgi:hypothetical protein
MSKDCKNDGITKTVTSPKWCNGEISTPKDNTKPYLRITGPTLPTFGSYDATANCGKVIFIELLVFVLAACPVVSTIPADWITLPNMQDALLTTDKLIQYGYTKSFEYDATKLTID